MVTGTKSDSTSCSRVSPWNTLCPEEVKAIAARAEHRNHSTIQKSLNSDLQNTNGPHNDLLLHEEPYSRIPKLRLPLVTEIQLRLGL